MFNDNGCPKGAQRFKIFLIYIDMKIINALYCAILFFVLTPNLFFRLPIKGSKMLVTAAHACIFGLILLFTQKWVWRFSVGLEGLDGEDMPMPIAEEQNVVCEEGQQYINGECVPPASASAPTP